MKQRLLNVTLFDLRNAFGEFHHNLVSEVSTYQHVPIHIQNLIQSLYKDFQSSIITPEFTIPFITVECGVLQGDCLSLLLFNMCFNVFIQYIKSNKFCQLGFCLKSVQESTLNPMHCFQLADDAAVINGQEQENQLLLNRFTIWFHWTDMIIRVDKCCTFGVKKISSKSAQYLPKLFINKEPVPIVKSGESFRYLGRHFDFDMSNQMHKTEVSSLVSSILNVIDSLLVHPKNKLLLYSRSLLSTIGTL